MKQWLEKGKTPQLILAAQIDEENNIVNFLGTITSKEFEDLVDEKRLMKKSAFQLVNSLEVDLFLLCAISRY